MSISQALGRVEVVEAVASVVVVGSSGGGTGRVVVVVGAAINVVVGWRGGAVVVVVVAVERHACAENARLMEAPIIASSLRRTNVAAPDSADQ